ncbi:MAG TPA: hypothetical protein VNS46_13240 [Nocardioides sp.]|nr:hypothetical protein [Nocardioides sp.]
MSASTANARSRRVGLVAWGVASATVVLALTRVTLAVLDPASSDAGSTTGPERVPGGGVPVAAFEATVLVLLAVVAALVASRRPENPIGWILEVIPLALGVLILSAHAYWAVALHGGQDGWSAAGLAWLASWVWIPAMVPLLTLFPLLFPTGRLLSRRWRPVLAMALAAGFLMFIGEAFPTRTFEDYPVENPFGIGPAASAAGGVGFLLMALAAIGAVTSLVIRFRRSHGEEREQLKWVTTAAVLFIVVFAVPTEDLAGDDVGFATLLVGVLVIASAIAVSVLRYRLYDIDVVINRALVYGSLTALLALTYLGCVLLAQLVLEGVTEGSGLAVAASTLATAALVRPARARIQAQVDRRFFRSRYDAAQTLAAFGSRLRDEVDLATLQSELRAVVAETMQPTTVMLWLRPGEPR